MLVRSVPTIALVLVAAAVCFVAPQPAAAQDTPTFTRQDSLRGTITPERAWWNLTYYHLDVTIDPATRSIEGSNTVHYRVLEPGRRMQIDLQPPLVVTSVTQDGRALSFEREGNVYWIEMPGAQIRGTERSILIEYSGTPVVARNAPWDGGFSWAEDELGNPFVATSCQGLGASVWWPNKDHMYDEPDSMRITLTVPDSLTAVSNGRLVGTRQRAPGTRTFDWFVANPINNYGVNANIGDYVHWSETYAGEAGDLPVDYWVLRGNEQTARRQFEQVPMMLEAFEHWFGPYPFYEDGYKLVEVPYLGMEHQSSVTYGNRFENGYLGRDLSGTGHGLKFDFIIIHESGHEWFANNITYRDIADMWIHEGFTAYSENLYVDYHFGTEAAADYVIGTRRNIRNDRPLIGEYDVNYRGSGDMYYKGANLLHMIRALVDDDERWRSVLRGLNAEFRHETVTTHQIEQYMIDHTGLDLAPVFNQYLRDVRIPTLETEWSGSTLRHRWTQVVDGFGMPVDVLIGGREVRLSPTSEWQDRRFDAAAPLEVDRDYYVLHESR